MTDTPDREGDRIAKLLARAGVASRREVERMIEDGRVKLNEVVITTPATLLTSLRGVTVDDKPVKAPEPTRLFAFHKPAGLITAERDMAGRPTIYAALRNALPAGAPRVMPVGRLDLNTEGLLLLTNDGEFKRALELPSTGVPRTYRARTFGEVSQAELETLMEGVEIEGVRYGAINANMERKTGRNQWIELTLTEGKNREVRRVLEHLGLQVSRLIRIGYGPFYLDDLPRGTAVEIAPVEVEKFRRALKLAPAAPHTIPAPTPRTAAPARPAPAEDGRPRRGGPPRRKPDPSRPDEAAGRRQPPAPRRAARFTKEDEHLLSRSEMGRRGARGAARADARPQRDARPERAARPERDARPQGETRFDREGRPQRGSARPPRDGDRTGNPPRSGPGGGPRGKPGGRSGGKGGSGPTRSPAGGRGAPRK